MTKMEKIDAMADMLKQKYGTQAAIAGYFKGLACSYMEERSIDFHMERLVAELQKDCGL